MLCDTMVRPKSPAVKRPKKLSHRLGELLNGAAELLIRPEDTFRAMRTCSSAEWLTANYGVVDEIKCQQKDAYGVIFPQSTARNRKRIYRIIMMERWNHVAEEDAYDVRAAVTPRVSMSAISGKGWRTMNDSTFDRATRLLSAALNRRSGLRALAGIALSGATGLVPGVTAQAADENPTSLRPIGDVSVEKKNKKKKKQQRKAKRCQKHARQCSVDVAGWCGTYWLDYESCRASLGSCCALVRKCNYGAADTCIVNNPYYFLVVE
jgi:hypothetical protein